MATYRLGSSPAVHTPGLIAWAINGYHFEEDRPQLLSALATTFPTVPAEAIDSLLMRRVDYTLDGETVIFAVEG